tara:strand:- start:171 stop:452 length:282 start_codon:yes stop_codon:yes gene_type:complete
METNIYIIYNKLYIMSDCDMLFMFLDKIIYLYDVVYEKYLKEETIEKSIELGNLYTIYENEDEVEEKDEKYINVNYKLVDDFILVQIYDKFYT